MTLTKNGDKYFFKDYKHKIEYYNSSISENGIMVCIQTNFNCLLEAVAVLI